MTRRSSVIVSSLVVVLALLLGASAVLANGNSRPGAAAARSAVGSPGRASAAGPPVSTGRFTLEFVDAELVDVFQALATQSGVNIAVSGSVKGKTTLRLRNVTLEQAMDIVTKLNGLDYAWVQAAYVVGTPEEVRAMRVSELRTQAVVLQHVRPEYAQEVLGKIAPDVTVSTQKGSRTILLLGTEASLAKAQRALAEMDVAPLPEAPTSEVVPIRYLKAEEVGEMIASSVPGVTVQPGTQPNSLLITADSLQWESVRSLISAADAPPPPAQATQAIYFVKYTSPSELQDTLTSLLPDVRVTLAPRSFTPTVMKPTGGAGGTAQLLAAPQYGGAGGAGGAGGGGGVQGGVGPEAEAVGSPVTALILTGAPWTVERALQILEDLDSAPKQVHIAAMVTEVSREVITRLGIDWSGAGESPGLGQTGVPVIIGEPIPEGAEGLIPARDLQIGKIQRSFLQWSGNIRALEEQGKARVLSNPSVTTLDGRQTALHTGETYYYEVAVAAATTGGIVKDIRTFDVGVSLVVNPRVNENGEITLTIAPTVAALRGTSEFSLPIVTERAVVTTVRVKSGETAVIAGLVTDEEQITIRKVPFLGDIPLVGELFKSRERRPSHGEVLIFVTPTIVEV
ncbi:MAG: secretin N-terminal domain-containing protein [Armatimonadota bacterium]